MAALIWAARLASVIREGPGGTTSGCEEISLFNVSQIRAGESSYADCFGPTYRTSLFNWLFYQSYGLVARAASPSEWDLPTPLRLFTAGWAALGCLATYTLLRGGRPTGAAAEPSALRIVPAAVAFVTWFGPVFGWWTLTARPDVAAVCFETLALAVVANRPAEASAGRGLGAGALFYLGWSFKQSAVTVLFGTLLGLVTYRNWKAAAATVGLFAGLVVVTLAVGDTNYWNNTITAHRLASWRLSVLKENLTGLLAAWGLLLLLIPALWRYGRMTTGTWAVSTPVRFLTVVFLTCLVFGVPGSSRWGSSRNYYFPMWVVGMALLGKLQMDVLCAKAARTTARAGGWLTAAVYTLTFVLCVAYAAGLFFSQGRFGTVRVPGMEYSPELLVAVRQSATPVFIQDPTLVRLALPEDAKNYPVLEEMIYWDALRTGLIHDGGVGRRMEDHYYRTLWLFTPAWEERAKTAGYVPAEHLGSFVKYVPVGG
jgi:hypothetical protein